jgi:enoyl-CoA hydratase/carnithine racemase
MTVNSIDTGDVRVEISEHVVVVTIDRPSKRNALTQDMYATISDTLLAADIDRDVGAVVMTGTDTVFTAGNDLGDFSGGARLDEVQRFLFTIASIQLPLVAAVNGLAVGVGLTMLLHCDLVFVDPNATLYVPFVELGLVPEAASSLLLPRVVGERRAAELLLSGRRIDGIEAAEWGLANAAASPALDAALAAAHHLAALPPNAVKATKALLRSNESTVDGRIVEEMKAFVQALAGSEFAETMAARTEKRRPVHRA